LQVLGGQYTSSEQVDCIHFLVKTLKLAVCYARDTSISMPETSVIFRLLQDYRIFKPTSAHVCI